ncbi:aminopeptidase [Candidatus Woesearchaeota archaeon]|nr:aminopeptidase [Candidatus Woesearchaeota archaeon]
MTEKKSESKNKKLQEKLFVKKESGWSSKNKDQIFKFSEDYKNFLAENKTEREVINYAKAFLIRKGFKDISEFTTLKTGDKVFMINKNKNVAAAVIGKETKLHVVGAHVDSPRLDLKPYPLFEDANVAMMKSHYYGGIKKYQWVARNLAMHGVVTLKDGKKVDIRIGDKQNDPVFVIPDLLPHLSRDQMKRDASKLIAGEELNILVGHIPVNDKDIAEKVKFEVLKYLNDNYGIIEEDLISSEIEFVPAENPSDVGFDRALVAAYGQDDRVCSYAGLRAISEAGTKSTSILLLFDKEEIGSEGDTGAKSNFTDFFVEKITKLRKSNESLHELFHKSYVLSADVTAALNPNFRDVHDPTNCSILGNGVSIEKYGGGGGKYSTNDASAEYMRYVVDLFGKNNVKWQTGELGRIDLGGGGTIAMYLAAKGCEVVDVGPCVLGMHSPIEVVSKFDIYQAFSGYKSFFND